MVIDTSDTDATKGIVTQTIYDGAGRITDVVRYSASITLPATIDVASINALLNAADTLNRQTRSFYDGDGKLVATLDGEGFLCDYQYSAAGRLAHVVHYASSASISRRHSRRAAR
jgi:YD repeat-containing protein